MSYGIDTYICMTIHSYKYTGVYLTHIKISERLSQLDLEIHEIS
jgi:hypothetical protein